MRMSTSVLGVQAKDAHEESKTVWPPGDAHTVLSVGGHRGFCILGTNPEFARDGRRKPCPENLSSLYLNGASGHEDP
ncbi:hypothetical protein PAL_GLEAN10020193 [Pteropus alecto]|uniref:Uncharacterized protein n=1 Tax=Pteropus alecto TaxID=9402 RepID=L5KT93_PTEAL|nr:hypothetical protein PAL_GLEAN10020193 [Pteropus alecto]